MSKNHWNRSARQSGGDRKARIPMAPLLKEELEILRQEQLIRKEFGEEGVRRFYEELKKKAKA